MLGFKKNVKSALNITAVHVTSETIKEAQKYY